MHKGGWEAIGEDIAHTLIYGAGPLGIAIWFVRETTAWEPPKWLPEWVRKLVKGQWPVGSPWYYVSKATKVQGFRGRGDAIAWNANRLDGTGRIDCVTQLDRVSDLVRDTIGMAVGQTICWAAVFVAWLA